MKKAIATADGIASVLPVLVMLFLLFVYPSLIQDKGPNSVLWKWEPHIRELGLGVGVLALIFHLAALLLTDWIPRQKKLLWLAVLLFLNLLANPVFWYLYVWRSKRQTELPSP